VRHLPIAFLLVLYVLVVGQNWAHYATAVMIFAYGRSDGRLWSVPFKLG